MAAAELEPEAEKKPVTRAVRAGTEIRATVERGRPTGTPALD
jgi:hypothetical protein